eukprot:Lithocolla_globosa_v1_NODE_704_length_3413_cov_16.427635.p2 type:complete len:100 gc:universal NODE_704_length_3413_cov_16.427635:1413-1114(-)
MAVAIEWARVDDASAVNVLQALLEQIQGHQARLVAVRVGVHVLVQFHVHKRATPNGDIINVSNKTPTQPPTTIISNSRTFAHILQVGLVTLFIGTTDTV